MGVSQRLFMYITCLINIAFNIMNMKNQDMLKIINKHVKKEVRDSYQTEWTNLYISKPWWFFHQISLKVMHPKVSPFSSERIHHQGTNTSHVM